MKNIEVTYDALICENGTYEQGEAAFILPMTDELAAEYLAGRATDRGAVNLVETALEAVEVMRGRVYVRGSIKAYREARKTTTPAGQQPAACLGLIRPADDGPGRAETGPARRGGRKENDGFSRIDKRNEVQRTRGRY